MFRAKGFDKSESELQILRLIRTKGQPNTCPTHPLTTFNHPYIFDEFELSVHV